MNANYSHIEPGEITWRSPSNIALIKYWGKYGDQLPRNPSISFTLAASFTDMRLEYAPLDSPDGGIQLEFEFHGEPHEAFRAKIQAFLTRMLPELPFLSHFNLKILSGNSFPHSAGIASSASAMSALALCLCSLDDLLHENLTEAEDFERQASRIARLASGSASRSIFSQAAIWGADPAIEGSSDEYAIPASELLHETFKTYHDDILIISASEKAVSSRAGHALMEGNPYASARYEQARTRLSHLLGILRTGDLEAFGNLIENEAMTLHALMMASEPSYLLIQPNTVAAIELIRQYRADTGHPIAFTLDAGPNIHLLYPEEIVHEVRPFVEEQLMPLCENEYVQHDWVGEGPEEV